MNRHVIRTSETDSVKGIATTQNVDVQLKQTTKALPFPNVSTTLSQRSVYEEERQAANKYRLILTVVPYCSNVLFNPLTEIIKDEGSDDVQVVTDASNAKTISGCYGLQTPTRVQMISNTEYSSKQRGNFTYHPGYDFFDNHILRNKTFKIVNRINSSPSAEEKRVFNTIADFCRGRDGDKKKYVKRSDVNNVSDSNTKHLYLKDDILEIDDSINQNLYEENGWWGFTNNTSIDAKECHDDTLWYSMDISRALNDHRPCEFIDMYPDRTLFSFSPKYNEFKHENENNWNVVITYPYKNVYTHPICFGGSSYIKRTLNSDGEYEEETVSEGNKWMGLKVMNASLGSGKAGGNNLIFRTYTKHGLSQQDLFYLYYTNPYKEEKGKYGDDSLNGNEVYYESNTYYKVTNVGDLSRNHNDYFFYTSNLGLVKELYTSYLNYAKKLTIEGKENEIPFKELYDSDDKKDIYDENQVLKTDLLNKILSHSNFRIRRFVRGIKSTYYLRLFRKIPNLRGVQREMTNEEKLHTSKFNGVFDKYIVDNALDPVNPKYQRLVNNEQYQMGFAASIYNDNVAQIAFTDGIDVNGLTDNLGRPLTEIYYTIVKNNAGHEAWYNEHNQSTTISKPIYTMNDSEAKELKKMYGDDYTIEFSHCFGKVTSGLDMYFKKDDSESVIGDAEYLKKMSSVHHIANITNNDGNIGKDRYSNNLDDDITYKDTYFYGDLVEFNSFDFKETHLSDIMHRFNTAQRETIKNPLYSQFQYHEITQDDYDKEDFNVGEFSAIDGQIDNGSKLRDDFATISRPEGYIYKAHYPIQIREYSRLLQDSHRTLRIRSAKPVQQNGILIQVTTLIDHKLNNGDIIFICDDESDTRYVTRCVKTISRTKFLMSPDYTEIVNNATDFEDKEVVSNFNDSVYKGVVVGGSNIKPYKNRFSWLELCEILNGNYENDITHPNLILMRKNDAIPDYATYIGGNQYVWREVLNIGDNRVVDLPDYIFANGYFYITNRINFYLKRQDPLGNNGLYFDGEANYPFFPNDPSGVLQKENNFIAKDTNVIC